MGRGKKRRRRVMVLFMLAAVMVWLGGCAVSKPLGLSSLMTAGSSKPVMNGGNGEKGPQTAGGMENKGDVVIAGNAAGAGSGVINGHLEGDSNGGLEQAQGASSTGTPDRSSGKSDKPDNDHLDKPDQPVTEAKPVKGKGAKLIALTFDDGPDNRYTTAILDILKEKEVKATFFVVGQQVSKNPEVLQRIVDEGHAVGNHTYNHKDLSELNKKQIIEEVNTADAAIKKAVGFTPVMFRAPYGAVSDILKTLLKANNRELIGWTIDTRDWAGTSADNICKMIKNEAKPGGIILMHSFGGKHIKNTVKALPEVIDELEQMGYTLVTADQVA